MTDVQDILRNLSVAPGQSGPEVVAADVARGRQAASRRSRRRFAFAGAFVAVAVAATAGVGQFGGSADPSGSSQAAPASQPVVPARLKLVSYTGAQPVGFKVSTVPDSWLVVSSDTSGFVVEPPTRGELPGDAGGGLSLEGRIAVSLQGLSHFPDESPIKKVDINGRTGELGHPLEAPGKLSDTRWLFFPDASGKSVNVQVPGDVDLSDEQVIDFAEGVSVTGDAVEIGG
ncbi:hypothetical protein [Actinoplanes derwentensis]|uniref:Uncharacterized protein n=1 Tax=Actinoplanes derwentensis TaxID=113562 RepID=A0A1H2CWI8_9ACTN|nr:hypothetical protein [Actinoplanes derwentensis]GID87860.1 hypothetical protein Ade03nite_67840 [Actinoplanes derwentensis]SDT74833.1 hypothetical protein SAMN04489716_7110 [Actinoplanes derwentensis]